MNIDYVLVEQVLTYGLMVAGLFPTLIGVITMFHWFRPNKAPADRSNRINSIRLWWFALTREDLFVDVFPWLKNDELKNVTKDK